METNNINAINAVLLPKQGSPDKQQRLNAERDEVASDNPPAVVTKRIASGTQEAYEKAQQFKQSAIQYEALADRNSKAVAAYTTLASQQQKAAISELMGVDIYA